MQVTDFTPFVTLDNVPVLRHLHDRFRAMNGKESPLESLVSYLLARIRESSSLEEGLKHLEVDRRFELVALPQAMRICLLGTECSNYTDEILLKAGASQETRHQCAAVLKSMAVATHFLLPDFASDDRALRMSCAKEGICIHKVKTKQTRFSHFHSFFQEVALQLGVEGDSCIVLCSNIKEKLWTDFFAGVTEPIALYPNTGPNIGPATVLSRECLAIILHETPLLASYLAARDDVHMVDKQGYNLAHFAAMMCNWNALLLLKRLGVSFDRRCATGATVYDFLRALGCTEKSNKEVPIEMPLGCSHLLYQWRKHLKATELKELNCFEKEVFRKFIARKEEPYPIEVVKNGTYTYLAPTRAIEAGELLFDFTIGSDVSPMGKHLLQGLPNCEILDVVYKGRVWRLPYALTPLSQGCPLSVRRGAFVTMVKSPFLDPLVWFVQRTDRFRHTLRLRETGETTVDIVETRVVKTETKSQSKRLNKEEARQYGLEALFQTEMIHCLAECPDKLCTLVEQGVLTHKEIFLFCEIASQYSVQISDEVLHRLLSRSLQRNIPEREPSLLWNMTVLTFTETNLNVLVGFLRRFQHLFTKAYLPVLIYAQHRVLVLGGNPKEFDTTLRALDAMCTLEDKELAFRSIMARFGILQEVEHNKMPTISLVNNEVYKTLLMFLNGEQSERASCMKQLTKLLTESVNENTSWTAFFAALLMVDFYTNLTSFESFDIGLEPALGRYGIPTEALKSSFSSVLDSEVFAYYMKKIAAFLDIQGVTAMDQGRELNMRLWSEFLEKKTSSLVFPIGFQIGKELLLKIESIYIAIFLQEPILFSSLLLACVDISMVDNQGYTLMHYAAMCQNYFALVILYRMHMHKYQRLPSLQVATLEGLTPLNILQGQLGEKCEHRNSYGSGVFFALWSLYLRNTQEEDLDEIQKRAFLEFLKGARDIPLKLVERRNGTTHQEICATRALAPGELIGEFIGDISIVSEGQQLNKHSYKLQERMVIDASNRKSLLKWLTQASKSYRAMSIIVQGHIHLLVYATRVIKENEPILSLNTSHSRIDRPSSE